MREEELECCLSVFLLFHGKTASSVFHSLGVFTPLCKINGRQLCNGGQHLYIDGHCLYIDGQHLYPDGHHLYPDGHLCWFCTDDI